MNFQKIILHRGLKAFVDICLILVFLKIRIRKLNLDSVARSCKFAVDQLVWKIRVRTLNVDFSPKIMQIHCQQMSTRWFGDVWRIRIPKLKLDLVPKSCKFAVNQMVWGMRILNLNLHLVPKSCK